MLTDPGETLIGCGAVMVTVALDDSDGAATLVAVMVAVALEEIVAGAV
jgi:hypothetical protein